MGGLDWGEPQPPKCPTQALLWVKPINPFETMFRQVYLNLAKDLYGDGKT